MSRLDVANAIGGDEKRELRALRDRSSRSREMLASCLLCEHRCGCDRSAAHEGPCRLGTETRVMRQEMTVADDPEYVPALRVYLAGCNFRCRFCNTAPDCFNPNAGRSAVPEEMAEAFVRAIEEGAHSIILLGGEPTLHAHTLLAVAAAAARPLPLVLNTNGYMHPDVIDLLGDVVSAWVVDFKFGNDDCAHSIARAGRYTAVLTRNLLCLSQRHRLHVRHLLLPGHLDCCFKPILEWVSTNLPGSRFGLMTGYVPHFRAFKDPILNRLNDRGDVREAARLLAETPLNWSID